LAFFKDYLLVDRPVADLSAVSFPRASFPLVRANALARARQDGAGKVRADERREEPE